MPTPFFPRSPAFWRYHLGALVFVLGVTLGASLIYGSLDRFTTLNSLAWTLPYTAAVLGFRTLVLRRGWQQRAMRALVPVVLVYSCVAGLMVIALLNAAVLPFFWGELAARQGPGFDAAAYLLRSVVGNGLQTQLFIAAWAFVYLSALNAERAAAAEVSILRLLASLKEAQLSSLSNQLQPHFLFNALNNIRFMVQEDGQRAEASLIALSDILRYSLQSSRADKVALAQELDAVRGYLALMQSQLEGRLRVSMHVEPPRLACRVPPMLLQMLVENAVKHGPERLPGGGAVTLSLQATARRLEIAVANDCPEPDGAPGSPGAHGLGLGLDNIRRRLELLYGELASLHATRAPGRFEVKVSLPLEATP